MNKMNVGNVIFLGVILLLIFQGAFAQLPSDVQTTINKNFPMPIQKSPNASSIERYGNYEVNLYTGLPSISIPLHTVESGPIQLPLSLSYHASGIRYTDQASWVGLGWSLMAGGQISRQIQKLPDEMSFLDETQDSNDYSLNWQSCDDWFYKENGNAGTDHEADIFSYTFPGKSGKFYLRQDGAAPYLFPAEPIKIKIDSALNIFEITDEKGILYRFGKKSMNDLATETTTTQGAGGNVVSGRTAWYLREIIAPNSDDIVEISYQSLGTQSLSDVEHNIAVIDKCNTDNATSLPCRSQVHIMQQIQTFSSTTNLGIKEIKYKTGKILFVVKEASREDLNSLKSLDRIEIYSKTGVEYTLIKTYKMNTSYFGGVSRLKLDELVEKDAAQTIIKKTGFSYHTDSFSWDLSTMSLRRDWFGFYNGKPNTDLIPEQIISFQPNSSTFPSDISIGSANRESDTTFLKEGVLKRITHPTNGYTEFQFEPHRYMDDGIIKYGGGLRVKRISNVTGSATYFKEFRYGENESGIGTKNFSQGLFYFYNETLSRAKCGMNPCSREERVRLFYSNSAIGAGYEDSPVVYLKVSEYENLAGTNGRIEYEFDNNEHISDFLMAVPYSNKTHRNSASWKRGKLTKKSVYNASNSLVSQTNVNYTEFKAQNSKISQAIFKYIDGDHGGPYISPCPDPSQESFYDAFTYQVRNFEQMTGVYRETSRSETLYENGLTYVNTTQKTYDPEYLQLLKEKIQVSSNPETIVTNYRYAFNLVNDSVVYSGYPAVLRQMVNRNILSPIEQYSVIQNNDGSQPRVIAGNLTKYKFSGTYLVPENMYFLELATPKNLNDFSPSTLLGLNEVTQDSDYNLRVELTSFDLHGNPNEIQKTNNPKISYLWGYEGAYVVAEVINAGLSEIAYTSFETEEKGGWTYSGPEKELPRNQAKAGISAYNLSEGSVSRNVAGASISNKFKLSFWAKIPSGTLAWNVLGETETLTTSWKLIEREVTNPTLSLSGGDILIDELRIHPIGAEMSTFTYLPGIGQGTKMDIRNRAVYYQYDRLGRLESILNNESQLVSHYEYNFIK